LIAAGTSPVPYSAASATLNADGTISTTAASGDKDNRSVMGGTHVAAMYGSAKKGLFLSAAMDNFSQDGYKLGDDYTQTSVAAQYKANGLTANAMMRTFDDGDGKDTGLYANLAYKMGKFTPKAKFMQADIDGGKTGTQVAVGFGYSLGKKTVAYAYTTTKDKNLAGGASKTFNIAGFAHSF